MVALHYVPCPAIKVVLSHYLMTLKSAVFLHWRIYCIHTVYYHTRIYYKFDGLLPAYTSVVHISSKTI